MDLTLAEAACSLLASYGAYLYGRSRGRRKAQNAVYEPPKAKCGCGHHYSLHDPEKGTCSAGGKPILTERGKPQQVLTYSGSYREYKVVYDYEKWAPSVCTCKRYVGPEPLNSITEGF